MHKMIKKKCLTTLIVVSIAAGMTECPYCNGRSSTLPQDSNNLRIPTYDKSKAKTKIVCGDFVNNDFKEGDSNGDGKYDLILEVYLVDKNTDGESDLIHIKVGGSDDVIKQIGLGKQALIVDDKFNGRFNRAFFDYDGDDVYDKEFTNAFIINYYLKKFKKKGIL